MRTTSMSAPAAVLHVHVAVWPVTDDHRTFHELVAEGSWLLEVMLADTKLVALGDTIWETRDDVAWPDQPAGALLLVARTPAATWDSVADLAERGGAR